MSETNDLPPGISLGRWLLFGLIAIILLAVVIAFFTWVANRVDDSQSDPLFPPSAEQAEWSIDVRGLSPSPGRVTLKGDLPAGFPTETWKDGEQLARSVGASFDWTLDLDRPLPTPVHEVNEIVVLNQGPLGQMCDRLRTILDDWAQQVAEAPGEAARAYTSAFAQHTLNTMVDNGCSADS